MAIKSTQVNINATLIPPSLWYVYILPCIDNEDDRRYWLSVIEREIQQIGAVSTYLSERVIHHHLQRDVNRLKINQLNTYRRELIELSIARE